MTDHNPFAPPTAEVTVEPSFLSARGPVLPRIASGQRLLLLSVLGVILFAILRMNGAGLIGSLGGTASVIGALVGIYRVSRGLVHHGLLTLLLMLGIFVPLLNIAVVIYVSSRATKALRAGGYKVGLLGATKSTV